MFPKCFFLAISGLILAGCAGIVRPMTAGEQNPPQRKAVAVVNGAPITDEELSKAAASDLDKLELQRMQFEVGLERNRSQVRENTLARLIEEKLLDAEAKKRGITIRDLLAKEVDTLLKEPTTEEINAFYEANKAGIGRPKEQVQPQIQQYLKQQNYNQIKGQFIERLKKEYGVTVSFEPHRVKLAVQGFPSRGADSARVTLVVFSDFLCPFCRPFSSTLERIVKDFSADVRLVFRQYPIAELHAQAPKAAEASLCAAEQSKFWELHDLMYKEQQSLSEKDLKAKAAGLGLDAAAFNTCLDSSRHREKVLQDIREGARAGVSGTPSLFVNGRFFSGNRTYEEVAATINEELQRGTAAPAKN